MLPSFVKQYLPVSFLILFALLGCHREEGERNAAFPVTVDLLSKLHAHLQQETGIIDFGIAANPKKYFLGGLDRPEKSRTWAIGLESRLVFYIDDIAGDLDAEIICLAIPSTEGKPQTTAVLVNGTPVGSIVPIPSQFTPFNVTIPASVLRPGQNILEFRFSYTTIPQALDPNVSSTRKLSVAFRKITFKKSSPSLHVQGTTREIDFSEAGQSEGYLIRGWSQPESDRTWAVGTKSRLLFYSHGPLHKIKLRITGHAMSSPDNLQQHVRILVNNRAVGTVTIRPNTFETYTLKVPAAALRAGGNTLDFEFAYAASPSQFTQNSGDRRQLAVAFQRIIFEHHNGVPSFEQSNIVQSADSAISLFVKLPEQFELDVRYRAFKGANAGIVFTNEHQETMTVELPRRKQAYTNTFRVERPGMYEMRVRTQGDPQGYTLWKELRLHTPDIAEEPPYIPPFQDYDVFYIVFDAFSAQHAGFHGYAKNTTPFLDVLASQSVVFNNMFANASYTLASTGTLFTSTYPSIHQLLVAANILNPALPTMNELLQQAGVETYLLTSHHYLGPQWGLNRGFSTVLLEKQYERDPEAVIAAIDEIYAESPDAGKFFYIHFIPPHFPYDPPQEFRQFVPEYKPHFLEPSHENISGINSHQLQATQEQIDYIASFYDSNIAFADHIAEQLFQALKARGLTEKSIIIFTSDHGEAFMEHGKMFHSSTVFDEMIHVPFLAYFPESAKIVPKRIEPIASLLDVAPTLLEIYGIPAPPEFSGTSLAPLIIYDMPVNDMIYAELANRDKTIRDTQYKYIFSPQYGELFFRLDEDPQEQHNVLDKYPVIAGYYRQTLRDMVQQLSFENTQQPLDALVLDKETIQGLKELGYVQ